MMHAYLYTNAAGDLDAITHKEVAAIEHATRYMHGPRTWCEYATTPTVWAPEQSPVGPLMEARPGKTEPGTFPAVDEVQVNRRWTLEDVEYVMAQRPQSREACRKVADEIGRTWRGVEACLDRIEWYMDQNKLRWTGKQLLRGKDATVYQWPVGFRNPKR